MKRNTYIDVFRGVCISLVVLGHCIQYGMGTGYFENGLYFSNVIFEIIYSFHMPSFMLISGFLFAYSTGRKSFNDLVKSKVKTLIIPLFVWLTAEFLVIQISTGNMFHVSLIESGKKYILYCLDTRLWFLWAIFYCSFIVMLVELIGGGYNKRIQIGIYVVIGCVSIILPSYFSADLYKYMYPYFLTGYFFSCWKGRTALLEHYAISKKNRMWFLGANLVLFAVLIMFFDKEKYIYTTGITVYGANVLEAVRQLQIDLYRWTIGFVGTTMFVQVVYLFYKLKVSWLNNIFIELGKCSMGIYIISGFCNTILSTYIDEIANYVPLVIGMETLMVLGVCYLLTKAIQKIRFLNICLLGGR